jgi:hypothetical protein
MSNESTGAASRRETGLGAFLRKVLVYSKRSAVDEALEEVIARPFEDRPRRDFADVVRAEEGDEARYEFIALQLGYARDSEADAYSCGSRARELLRQHGASWADGIRGEVRSYEFNRGFVERIELSARAFLSDGERLTRLAPILHLDLTDAAAAGDKLFDSPALAGIHSLSLSRGRIGDDEIRRLAGSEHLKNLRWLSLAQNQVTLDGVRELARSPYLRRLEFVNLFENPADPRERYSHDQGVIVDRWLPREGEELEAEFGALPWLHIRGDLIADVQPDRFRMVESPVPVVMPSLVGTPETAAA